MSLKPTYLSDTKEQQICNYAGAVTEGPSGVEEGTLQDEVEVKGGSHNDVQEDTGRDLDTVKGDDGKRGRDLEQFGDASILKGESRAPLEQEYRSMVSTPDQAVGEETIGGELPLDRKDLPRGAWAKMLEEEAGRYLGPVKGDDGNMGRGLDRTTEVSYQFGDTSILQGESQAPLELESTNMVSTPDLVAGLSLDGSGPHIPQQQEQAVGDETAGSELLSDREGISAKDHKQQVVVADSQDLPEEVVLILFKLMKPGDILAASQTCQLWRIVGENDKLWEQKCQEAGLANSLTAANQRALERRNENTSIAYSAWKENFVRPYKIARKFREGVPQVITIEMEFFNDKMKFFNDKMEFFNDMMEFFNVDDLYIVSGRRVGSLKVWDVNTGSCLHTLNHMGRVECLQVHGTITVFGSFEHMSMCDVREGTYLRTLTGHTKRVVCVQFDGRLVVSGSLDKTIKIWDPETGECLRTLRHRSRILILKFNGVDVVAGYCDGSIKVWEVDTGVCRHTLEGTYSLPMELQGDMLVCGDADKTTVKIWNISTGAFLHTLAGPKKHSGDINGIGVNDKFVVTSLWGRKVKLWDIKTGEFIRDVLVLKSGEVVHKMKMKDAKIVCCVETNERSKFIVLNFDTDDED